MAVYQPKYRNPKTGRLVKSRVWWFEFTFAEKRVRESAKTTRKTIAIEAERQRRLQLEKTLAGIPTEKRENRIRSVADMVKAYKTHYGINHRQKSVEFSESRLEHITRLLGAALLPDVNEDAIRSYIRTRLDEGASGRTINMEVGELSRAIGQKSEVVGPLAEGPEARRAEGRRQGFVCR
jgi:hypothetical protein